MLDRRSFLKSTGSLAAASLFSRLAFASSFPSAAAYPPIGLQTYTLGFLLNVPNADTSAVLKLISEMGVKELETATGTVSGLYYGLKPKEFAKRVNDHGMKWIANHVRGLPRTAPPQSGNRPDSSARPPASTNIAPRTNLNDHLQQIVDEASEGGCSWVVCSSSAEATTDEIKRTTELFAKTGEAARKHKMKFAYHNHQSEFVKIDGISAYDYILGQTSKDEVFMEVDIAWATQAGMDPVEMFKQYPGRFPLWHVKDIDPSTNRPCPVGKGKIDFKRIYENSKLSGVQHTFIEQDGARTADDPAESVKWLKANVYA